MEEKTVDQIVKEILDARTKLQQSVNTEPKYRRMEIAGVKIIAEKHVVPAGTAFVSDDVMCKLIDLLESMGAEATKVEE